MKRLAALASALLLCGCACDGAQPPAPTVLPTAAVAAQDDADPLARAAGAYELTGGEDSLGSGGCDSFFADENAVLVLGGALSGTGATIDKTAIPPTWRRRCATAITPPWPCTAAAA